MQNERKTIQFTPVADISSYDTEIELQKKRAERFGIEFKGVTFPGMVPKHKRHENETDMDLDVNLYSKEEFEKRLNRFNNDLDTDYDKDWFINSLETLKQVYNRKLQKPFKKSSFLPSCNIRIPCNTFIQRPNCLHVYGVDKLDTKQIFNYFISFQPKFIEWLDDSSCNVIFNDQDITNTAFNTLGMQYNNDNKEIDEKEKEKDEDEEEREIPRDINIDTSNDYDFSFWRIGQLINNKSKGKNNKITVFIRIGYINDKTPDYKTRLEQYNKKQKKLSKGPNRQRNRNKNYHRHEPYKRKNQKNIKKEEIETNISITKVTDNSERSKRFGGMIGSIINQDKKE